MENYTETLLPQISKGLTKTQISQLKDTLINNVLEEGNPIEVVELLSNLSELEKQVKEDPRFRDYLLTEIAKHGKGLTRPSGTKIELFEAGTKYNYDKCNDKEYFSLLEEKVQLLARIEAREKFLKGLPEKGVEVLYEDELIVLYPPSKSSTSSFKITMAK